MLNPSSEEDTGRLIQTDHQQALPASQVWPTLKPLRREQDGLLFRGMLTPRSTDRPQRGRPLTAIERQSLAAYIPLVDLDSALLHEGIVPLYLPRRYQAIARGTHIYFRAGVYNAAEPAGLALLGHELVHVGQYRDGMTWLAYLWAARRGYTKSPYEQAAVAMQSRIFEDLRNRVLHADI
jgi:hypothetical protein